MASNDLDYDDIISQNIVIRREEAADSGAIVEVLTKQSEDYEDQYNRQAAIYHMDEGVHTYLETSIKDDEENISDSDLSEESEYEIVIQATKRASSEYEDDSSSSDGEWGVAKRRRSQKLSFECDECDKKCATKRGLDMHKRSHQRQKQKSKPQQRGEPQPEPQLEGAHD